mgnify:CR=1 FL=1
MTAIDVHAHYPPRRLTLKLERKPGHYGVGIER